MLDPAFPPYSPGARRLYQFEEAGEQHLLSAELERTLAAFSQRRQSRIDKGQVTAGEYDATIAVWAAIAADVMVYVNSRHGPVLPRLQELRDGNGVAWADKVEELRRELEARRAGYPAAVDRGQLTRDQAQQQLERLAAVHDLYWRQGYAFDGTREEGRALSNAVLDADVARDGAAPISSRGDSSKVEHSADQPTVAGSNPAPRSKSGAFTA
jgi:hypothetical protein